MSKLMIVILVVVSLMVLGFPNCLFGLDEMKKEEWNPVTAGPVTTWTAPLCGKGKFVIQPFFFYNHTRGTFDSSGDYNLLPKGDRKGQSQQQLFMQYGLTDTLEIDCQGVYQENFRKQGDAEADSNGFGDSYLFARYCAIEESENFPHLVGLFQLKLPTGKYEKLDADKLGTDSMGAPSGGGSYDHGYGLMLTKKIKPFILHIDAIMSFPTTVKVDGVKTEYAPYLNCDFGAEYILPWGFNLMLELNGFVQGDKKQGGGKVSNSDINSLTIAPGVGWSNEKIQTLLAYQRTLTGTNTDANDSVIFTFVYAF